MTYAINNGISYEIADYMSLNGIAIQSLPLSTTYIQGSEFDFEGLYVVAHYDIGDLQLNDYTLTYDKDTLGPQTVTVSYLDYTATFEITVVAPSITRIEVTPPSQTEYIEGVALNLTDMLVKAFWDNGNETFIPLDSVSVIGDTDSIASVFSILLTNVEFRKAYPADYRLFQVADLLCTMELIKRKHETNSLSRSEQIFFGSVRDLKKNYLRPMERLQFLK